MKQGQTLQDLAFEIDRQSKARKDFVADTSVLTFVGSTNRMRIMETDYVVNDLCHDQIALRLGIPRKYYSRMQTSAPELLSVNINHWFRSNPEKRMIRTWDDTARAFLSSGYRPLDNIDLLEAVLPKVQELGCRVESCQVTDKRLYIKVITEQIETEVSVGDRVQAGLVISNSEVGCGSIRVEPMVYRLVCKNGMIAADRGMKKYHVGRRFGDDEDSAREFYRDATRQADDKAFWLKVRDVVEGTLDSHKFELIVNDLRKSTEKKIIGDPVQVVENVAKSYQMTDQEQGSVLRHLISGGDLSCYGVSNAVTRTSQDLDDYDRATEFERLGGEIITLSDRQWSNLN